MFFFPLSYTFYDSYHYNENISLQIGRLKRKMPILYSVISRGPIVLAKNAECVGNFAEVTEQIIKNIPSHNHKLTYAHGSYLIHFISEDRIIYMCK